MTRIKLSLSAIYEDGNKHHKLLNVRDKLAKAEAFEEPDLWDAVWKDSPWYGAPGG